MSNFEEAARQLTDAAANGNKGAAWEATGVLVWWLSDLRNRADADQVRTTVWSGPINNCWFDIAELVAGAAAARADATPAMSRLHAQMLMERGFTEEALARLKPLLNLPALSDYDREQILGHIGRINKDRYIAAAASRDLQSAKDYLRRAIDAYHDGFTAFPSSFWHGINAASLLARPEALEIYPDAKERSASIARTIGVALKQTAGDVYRLATLAEVSLALGDFAASLSYVRDYVSDPNVKGFQFNNFLRQLTRLWQLDRQESPGPEIVAMVRAALLQTEGGSMRLSGSDLQRAKEVASSMKREAVFGADRFDSFENYRRGLDRCGCVARIGRTVETGVGTGFVVQGRALCPKLDDSFVLVTNAHVISDNERESEAGSLHPSEAIVTFAAMDGVSPDKEFTLTRVYLSSPPDKLDVTVAGLSEPVTPKVPYQVAPVLPARGAESNVRVIGHPSGRGLSLSVNKLLDHQDPKLHYRTATEGGSSGSPVFNQEWKLIGLHHAGGDAVPKLNGQQGTYQANEGIWIQAICKGITEAMRE